MTSPATSPLVRARKRLGTGPAALWVLSAAVCWAAPYFRTIRPRLLQLDPGTVRARFPLRRAVTNHLGSVHAIAMCNAAEFVAGTCMEVSVADGLRWIPVGMTVRYVALARTDVVAVATTPASLDRVGDVVVPVQLTDAAGTLVFTAEVTMRVSERRRTG